MKSKIRFQPNENNASPRSTVVERRKFIANLAVLGAAALVPTDFLQAHMPASTPAKPFRIDAHHHFSAPGFIAAISARKTNQRPLELWTPEKSIEDMDKGGVATSMISTSEPSVWFGDNEAARKLARECNEYGARLIADHPSRFGMYSTIPLPDIVGSLREIEYSLDTLKADGVCMMTSYQGKYPGDPAFAPVMSELNRRKAVVFFHPVKPECCKDLQPDLPNGLVELSTDTTRAIASLVLDGTASRYPDIRFIFSHGGGTMPYLMTRFAALSARPDIAQRLPNGFVYEIQKLYFDTANFINPYPWPTLLKLMPVSHILFGTDFPFSSASEVAKGLREVGLSPADLQFIERDNALRLFPRLK
ncbi:MAG TPA: amidohydrolase family protein [Candidatus Saccharimonadales bacterium]|jgi:predicted TIM-barrel fold metal-dependent hydrolase|nr:amidohydrolase family protein [Candidatus Saccharimonadales bacterium]